MRTMPRANVVSQMVDVSTLRELAALTQEPAYRDLIESGRFVRRVLPSGVEILQVERCLPSAVRAIDEESREVTVVASDATLDHYGDTIDPEGWDTDTAFKANPVSLLDHNYRVSQITGHHLKWWVEDGEFRMLDRFDPAGTNAAADMAFAKVVNKSLRASSVGFIPLVWENREEEKGCRGIDFKEQILLERSWVAVPANPAAVIPATGLVAAGHTPPDATLEKLHRIDQHLTLAAINGRFTRRA